MNVSNKTRLAEVLGVSRRLLYYEHKQPKKDWELKTKIELALRDHPGYGHKRLAIHLGKNKKAIIRVMNIYGIKPYRLKGKKFKHIKLKKDRLFKNLLLENKPSYPNHVWTSDFTHIAKYNGRWVYLATILDLYTRKIVGFSVLLSHSSQLVTEALLMAIFSNNLPEIIHSDQGSEYASKDYANLCESLGIRQSMSNPGCPWENGYQESFYDKFKIDLADASRFNTLGELIYNIYKQIYYYNNSRIHTSLNMPPVVFERLMAYNAINLTPTLKLTN